LNVGAVLGRSSYLNLAYESLRLVQNPDITIPGNRFKRDMPFFKSNDSCRIYYEYHDFDGEKTVVVFLNGKTQTTITWGLQVRQLKKRFRILLYDARGQGQSDLGQADLTLDGHVDDLLQLLDHLTVNRAHLVGLSHGARVACRFGAITPERTGRMILCGLGRNLDPRTVSLLNSWIQILNSGSFEAMVWSMLPIVFGETFLEQHQSKMNDMVSAIVKRNRTDAVKAHLKAMTQYLPVRDSMPEVYPPALVVAGDQDLVVRKDQSRALAKMLGAHLVQLKGVGHSPNMEAPEAFNQVLLQFLSTINPNIA
jgi:3-oxoadipate enol-lactonase